jgi:hypothetical protein
MCHLRKYVLIFVNGSFLGERYLHRSRHVRPSRAPRARDSGGLRDGRGQDYAEGYREEHVHQEVVQVEAE